MSVDIVIPVRGQLPLTQSIVEQLQNMEGWNHCWILDNGKGEDDTWDWLQNIIKIYKKFTPLPAAGMTIYEMWDKGFYCSRFVDNVLFLNNDVKLHPRTITALNQALESDAKIGIAYPDYNCQRAFGGLCNYRITSGTFRHGGMSGYCFMLKRAAVKWGPPLIDPSFKLWYGDDDIAFEVERAGYKQARVVGLPIEHIGQATTNAHPEVMEHIPRDREAFIAKWGNR